jgi:hypothetical protein
MVSVSLSYSLHHYSPGFARLRNDAADELSFFSQFCVYLDCGHHLVQACYILEGDGLLILRGYDLLQNVEVNLRSQGATAGLRCQTILNTYQEPRRSQAAAKMRLALKPVHDYFLQKITVDFVEGMNIMKAARYWDPRVFVTVHRTGEQSEATMNAVLHDIAILKWISEIDLSLLRNEFLSYYASAREFQVAEEEDQDPKFIKFFSDVRHTALFPTWCSQFFNVILLQTSEGTVERSFSDFGNVQNSTQVSRMEETLCASTMARYNFRDDAKA